MYSKIPAKDLAIGMFVADIDRPWIDTPFLLQGFLIEDPAQIAQLQQYCQEVTIDRARSTAAHQSSSGAAVSAPVPTAPKPAAAATESRTTAAASARPPTALEPMVISTRDAEFRPTESGRFILTPKPSIETGNAPKEEPQKGLARSLLGALGRLVRRNDEDEVVATAPQKYDDDAHRDEPISDKSRPLHRPPSRPTFLPPNMQVVTYTDTREPEEERAEAQVAIDRTGDLLHRMAQDIRSGRTIALAEVEEVITEMVDSMVRNPDALMWVMRLRDLDSTTYGHGLYASVYLLALGRHLGFPKENLAQLGTIGLLLDIGKIKLPQELLNKNGRLTDSEYATIKTHVQLGIDILSESKPLHQDVMAGISQHHERENGSGYPRGLAGPNISLFGRMAAIADCFAALTNQRPYAEAVSAYDALRSLSGWGGEYFHAPVVEQFIQAIGVFPVGSLVELSTGEVAAVISHNRTRRLKPRVLIITGPDKTPSKHPAMMDMLYAPMDAEGQSVFIRRGLASGAYGLDAKEFYIS